MDEICKSVTAVLAVVASVFLLFIVINDRITTNEVSRFREAYCRQQYTTYGQVIDCLEISIGDFLNRLTK